MGRCVLSIRQNVGVSVYVDVQIKMCNARHKP